MFSPSAKSQAVDLGQFQSIPARRYPGALTRSIVPAVLKNCSGKAALAQFWSDRRPRPSRASSVSRHSIGSVVDLPEPPFSVPKTMICATARAPNAAPRYVRPSLNRGANCCGYYVLWGKRFKHQSTQRKTPPPIGGQGAALWISNRGVRAQKERGPRTSFLELRTRGRRCPVSRGGAAGQPGCTVGSMSSERRVALDPQVGSASATMSPLVMLVTCDVIVRGWISFFITPLLTRLRLRAGCCGVSPIRAGFAAAHAPR